MKIKNLFNTGKMNKDVDERLIPNGEYIEASNLRVLNTAGSDAGALENEKGNVKLTNLNVLNQPECIGSVADESEEKIYWFVVNDLGYSYIYEYDRVNDMTSQVLADERTGDSQVLGFDKDYKITGVNIFYNIPNKEKLLVFTDNLNHPRCININRAKTYGLSNFEEDDIILYKKPPYEAPKITPNNTLTASENTVKERFFSFAYRYKYLDGEFSALSSFSNYQFVPGLFDLDANTVENNGMVNIFNSYLIDYNTGDKRVTDIQLCFKTSNDSNIYIIDTINKKESSLSDNTTKKYTFTNKKISKQLPPDEITRTFDNVPLKAAAQDVIEDRLVFGNYTTQYDLKENKNDANNLAVDYHSEFISKTQDGDELTLSYNNDLDELSIDLTDVKLKKGFTFFLSIELSSDEAGTQPDLYFGGSFNGANAIVLNDSYNTVSDFANSSDFDNLLDTLTNNFLSAVETTPPDDTATTTYGEFELASVSTSSIDISAPTITYVVDNTPGDSDITDGDTTEFIEVFKYLSVNTTARYSDSISNTSLKSLRNYEVGICYLDKYGRYSSIIPSKIRSEFSNDIFIPIENATDLNSIRTTVESKAPYWADRYKFFIKDSKNNHYNIFGTFFYEEGVYRWVKLEGSNLGKVKEGDFLIVKADDNGPLGTEIKVKVIEYVTKTAADERENIDGENEGWIEGNEDSQSNNIIEDAGTYIKIKPIGFSMDYNPYNYPSYQGSGKVNGPFGSGSFWGDEGYPNVTVPSQETSGLIMDDTNDDGFFEYQTIGVGSRIKFDFYSYQRFDSDGDDRRLFLKEYTVTGTYDTDSNSSAFEKWLDAETEWYQPTGETYWVDPNDQFRLTLIETGTYSASNSTYRVTINIEATKFCARADTAWIKVNISVKLVSGLLIFETQPEELDTDIYYETEQTFKIENGLHKGNFQDQTSSQPAICDLTYFNCFSFGNGCESVSVRDDRFTYRLGVDYRPNITLEQGYKELQITHGLIHSGSYNENSGYNAINEFNSSRGITKNLDTKYGSIQKIFSRERDLIIFQEDRVSKVLYGKTILSSPDGTGSLSQIENVFGQDVPYAGEYGISKNPESFASFEGKLYFTDANRGAVLRLGGDGITPISYKGMKAFFKENLYDNKNSWNIGGFDPRNHQYVLSLGADNKPVENLELNCTSEFTKTINSAFTYDLNVGIYAGNATINYTSSNIIDIEIVYNGNTYTHQTLTGSGTITFPVSESDIDVTSVAEVTITPASFSVVTITHECIEPDTLDVVLVVVNDSAESGETIINRYKHSGTNIYNSDLDVFEFSGTTKYEVINGIMGTDIIPDNGDVVTISSLKQIGVHTGNFNTNDTLGYLVSSTTGLTVDNIVDQATYPTVTQTKTSTEKENTVTFTFNRTSVSEKLYLVWNYTGEIDDIEVTLNPYFASSTARTSSSLACADAVTETYYTSSAGLIVGATVFTDSAGTTYMSSGFYNTTTNWIEVNGNGVIISIGTCSSNPPSSSDSCEAVWISDDDSSESGSQDLITGYGLYYTLNGNIVTTPFNQFLATPFQFEGVNGKLYFICTSTKPLYYEVGIEDTPEALPQEFLIITGQPDGNGGTLGGGSCTANGDCSI